MPQSCIDPILPSTRTSPPNAPPRHILTQVRPFTSAPRLVPTSDAPLRPGGTRVRPHSDHPALPEPFDVDAINCLDHSRPLSLFNGALDPGTAAAPCSVPIRQRTGFLGNCECCLTRQIPHATRFSFRQGPNRRSRPFACARLSGPDQ